MEQQSLQEEFTINPLPQIKEENTIGMIKNTDEVEYAYTFYSNAKLKEDTQSKIIINSAEKQKTRIQLNFQQLNHKAREVSNVDNDMLFQINQASNQNKILLDDEYGMSGMVIKLNDEAFINQHQNNQLNEFVRSNNLIDYQQYTDRKTREIEDGSTKNMDSDPLKCQKSIHHQHTNSRLSAFSYNDSRTSSAIMTSLASSMIQPLPYHPQYLICPHCFHSGMSIVKRSNGKHAYGAAGVCCLMGCWAGCQCIPLICCDEKMKDNYHYCRECGELIQKISPHF